MKYFFKVIYFLVTAIQQGYCNSPSICLANNQQYCLTEYGTCTSFDYDCSPTCSVTSDCNSSIYTCCNGYCTYNSYCSIYKSSNSSMPTVMIVAIVVPVVLISVVCCCFIIHIVRAKWLNAIQKNKSDTFVHTNQNLMMQMQKAQDQQQIADHAIMEQQMVQQQQMLQIQQQMQQQQGGIMYGVGYQMNQVVPSNAAFGLNNQLVIMNPQMISNQILYVLPEGQLQSTVPATYI